MAARGSLYQSERAQPESVDDLRYWLQTELDKLSDAIEVVYGEAVSNLDFLTEVAKGNVAGHSLVHKFGRNDNVTAQWEHISMLPFDPANFRTSAVAMQIASGGAAADAPGQAGAAEVIIQGIDDSFNEVTSTITTAGTSASTATTELYWRVHRMWVSSTGTYSGNNSADIIIEDSGSANDVISIAAGEGQSQYCGWTCPVGKKAYLLSVTVTVDSSNAVDVRMFTRENIDDVSTPFSVKRIKQYWDGVSGTMSLNPDSPMLVMQPKTDIWFEAYGVSGGAEVALDFELLVVDD